MCVLRKNRQPSRIRTVFKDPVHNIIPVNEYEYTILQHPILNRLHGIKQLGFTFYVYPQAKHSRFEHSIGVMHIAGRIADAIEANSPDKTDALLRKRSTYQDFKQIARLVGLLHDVGHLPYSHITEMLVSEAASRGETSEAFERVLKESKERGLKLHEYYSCLFAEKLTNEIKKEKDHGKLSRYLLSASHVLCRSKYGDPILSPAGIETIAKIISGDILDADKIDYLARDAYNTGSTYGIIDIERIISGLGLALYDNELVLSVPSKLLSSIEELYYARYMMYKWVYFHHKVISLDLTYRSLLSEVSKRWSAIRKKLCRLFPKIPSNFWDLFLPESIWKSSVKYGYRIDDSFIDLIFKVSASSTMPQLSTLSRGILDRRLPLFSVLKREEDLISAINSISKEEGRDIDALSTLDSLSEVFSLLIRGGENACSKLAESFLSEDHDCCSSAILPNEKLSCIAEKYIEKELGHTHFRTRSLRVYVSPPISLQGEIGKIILSSDKQMIPILRSSLILREIMRLGSRPLVYVYSEEKLDENEKNSVRKLIGEFLINLERGLREGKWRDEDPTENSGVRTK